VKCTPRERRGNFETLFDYGPGKQQNIATHCDTVQHSATHLEKEIRRERRGKSATLFDYGQQIQKKNATDATQCNTLQHTWKKRFRERNEASLRRSSIVAHEPQNTATQCKTLQHSTKHCNTIQNTATQCKTLQYNWKRRIEERGEASLKRSSIMAHQNNQTLQHNATHCNTPEKRDSKREARQV